MNVAEKHKLLTRPDGEQACQCDQAIFKAHAWLTGSQDAECSKQGPGRHHYARQRKTGDEQNWIKWKKELTECKWTHRNLAENWAHKGTLSQTERWANVKRFARPHKICMQSRSTENSHVMGTPPPRATPICTGCVCFVCDLNKCKHFDFRFFCMPTRGSTGNQHPYTHTIKLCVPVCVSIIYVLR